MTTSRYAIDEAAFREQVRLRNYYASSDLTRGIQAVKPINHDGGSWFLSVMYTAIIYQARLVPVLHNS